MARYPAIGETFELTLNGDEHPPLDMVTGYGYPEVQRWQYIGTTVTGIETKKFKLIQVGKCDNLTQILHKIREQEGEIPPGQWLEALKKVYGPTGDDKRLVGIADASWKSQRGHTRFPYIYSNGIPKFAWSDHGFGEIWCWLVFSDE